MKTQVIIQSILILFALAIITASAAPPANDNFGNAQTISGLAGSIAGTSSEATREPGEPIHALNRGGASVWYRYVAPGNGVLKLSTAQSSYNTLLAVYTGTSLSNLKLVASSDDFGPPSGHGAVTIGTQLNTTYYIAVDGYNNEGAGAAAGSVGLEWIFQTASVADSFATPHYLLTFPRGQRVESNVGASKELGEPDHDGNAGGKSVWFRWTAPQGSDRSYTFSTKGSVKSNGSGSMFTLLAIYTGTSVNSLTQIASASGYSPKIVLQPVPDTVYYLAVDGYDFGQGADTGTINLTWRITDSTKDLDFDGDDRADVTVFRPTNGIWYTKDSITDSLRAVAWGANGDAPLPGRFDSDDRLDYNVFRPDTATWWTQGSQTGVTQFFWGINTDIPFLFRSLQNDYVGMYRMSSGNWYIYIGAGYSVNFGTSGDYPVPADYDGDGNDNIVIFRPATGTWWFLNQITGAHTAIQFGLNGDKPVPADYDGDGRADLAVYRPTEGTWYVRRSSDGGVSITKWGTLGDKTQPGDYDNDGRADLAVYRPSTATWYILRSSDGQARFIRFGLGADMPLTYSSTVDFIY